MASRISKYFGNYPAEYNRAIHGPYSPSRFYGKADTPLGNVKVSELVSWINRRNVHPVAVYQGLSRAYYRWQLAYNAPKYASPIVFLFQFIAGSSIFFYFMNYPKNISHHKQYKYHW